jgi:hypothetical protein
MTKRTAFALVVAAAACKPSAPATPEDKLLRDLGNALTSNDRNAAVALYDLEVRQKLEFWETNLKNLHKQDDQLAAYQAGAPRLGDAAALVTVGEEAWEEARGKPWAEELAAGKCAIAPPATEDLGRGVMPKEDPKKMSAEVGRFVFELRTAVAALAAFRVNCPGGGTFWVEMSQRKKTDALKLVRLAK